MKNSVQGKRVHQFPKGKDEEPPFPPSSIKKAFDTTKPTTIFIIDMPNLSKSPTDIFSCLSRCGGTVELMAIGRHRRREVIRSDLQGAAPPLAIARTPGTVPMKPCTSLTKTIKAINTRVFMMLLIAARCSSFCYPVQSLLWLQIRD